MARIVFYEKPRCVGNARQRALLIRSGHELEVRDILSERWTADRLRPFFGGRPVGEWFNRSAPRVKSGEVTPDELSEQEALTLMLQEPLLIRRPLMQVGDQCRAGFDMAEVDAWVGLAAEEASVKDACPRDTTERGSCA